MCGRIIGQHLWISSCWLTPGVGKLLSVSLCVCCGHGFFFDFNSSCVRFVIGDMLFDWSGTRKSRLRVRVFPWSSDGGGVHGRQWDQRA